MADPSDVLDLPVRREPTGKPLACRETIKMANEKPTENRDMCPDAVLGARAGAYRKPRCKP